MPADERTHAATSVGQRGYGAVTGAHHHASLLSSGHVTAAIAFCTLLCLLGAAFALSWRHSGDRLRSILSEFEND